MAAYKLPAVVDLDHFAVGQDLDALAGLTIRHRVAFGMERDKAVLGYIAQRALLKDVGPTVLHREQQALFLQEHLRMLPVCRAVDAFVGEGRDPGEELGVEVIQARELLPPEEALDILDARLDLAVGLGPVGPMRRPPEAEIPAEVPEDRVPSKSRPKTTDRKLS